MMGKKAHNQHKDEFDEHDLPTEPLPDLALLPPDSGPVPAPLPYEQPFPRRSVQGFVPGQRTQNGPKFDTFPYPPPGFPGQQIASGPPVNAGYSGIPVQAHPRRTARRSPVPTLVGLFFVVIQLLLLARFVMRGINLPADTWWVESLYALSNVFLLPFQAFLPPLPAAIPANVELYTLLALLVYSLLSRLLVHMLKILLRTL